MFSAPSAARFSFALVVAAIAAPFFFSLGLNVLLLPNKILSAGFWILTLKFSLFAMIFGFIGALVVLGLCYGFVLNRKSIHAADIFLASFIAVLLHSVTGFIIGSVNSGAAILLGFIFEASHHQALKNYSLIFASKLIAGFAAGGLFLTVLGRIPAEE